MFTSSDDKSAVRPSECHCQHSGTNVRSPVHRTADPSSTVCHNVCHYSTPTLNIEQCSTYFDGVAWDSDITSFKEHFVMMPLDNEVWSEDPIPDRQLCIDETPHKPNHQCSYSCPCSTTTFRIDLPKSTPQDTAVFCYELMDFSDIPSDLPDIMTVTSDDDIPHLEDISDLEYLNTTQHGLWFAKTFYLAQPRITNTQVIYSACHKHCIYCQNWMLIGYSVHYSKIIIAMVEVRTCIFAISIVLL